MKTRVRIPYLKAVRRSIDSLRPLFQLQYYTLHVVRPISRRATQSPCRTLARFVGAISSPSERHDGGLRGYRNQRSSFAQLRGFSRLPPVDDTVETFGSR